MNPGNLCAVVIVIMCIACLIREAVRVADRSSGAVHVGPVVDEFAVSPNFGRWLEDLVAPSNVAPRPYWVHRPPVEVA